MYTQLKKIGNSKGVIIPAGIIKLFGMKEHDQLNIEVHEDEIILRKAVKFDPKSLEDLFEGYKGNYQEEIVFDDAKGREEW
jgi:AbrB family looped-hinge helix DNA binding protein